MRGQRVETSQRDSAVGLSFLRGGARPPITEVVTYIDAHRSESTGGLTWGVEPICEQLRVAPSTYYAAKSRPTSKRSLKDRGLGPQLKEIWKTNYSDYGRRKLRTTTFWSSGAIANPTATSRTF